MRHLKTSMLGATALVALGSFAQADQVVTDDQIVQGSICVGLDCVNGESFGFETIRIKENNLRIGFVDTSSSASFPSNDWQITINDSSNGGGNYFGIRDETGGRTIARFDAGAPADSLRIDSGGDLGLGTSAPVTQIHVVDGNTPTLRLEQDGSSGFTAQTYDIASNEANFFVRDVTNGSRLVIRAKPGAPGDALFIDSNGDIGMGTDDPDHEMHVMNDGNAIMRLESTTNSATQYRMQTDNSNQRRFVGENSLGETKTQMAFRDNDIRFAGDDFQSPWATISATGIVTTGAGACNPGPCDGTFDPEIFEVPSIEEAASFMWENKYLWGVGPTPEGEPINLTRKTTGILHELEKAHIFIEQLNDRLKAVEEELEAAKL